MIHCLINRGEKLAETYIFVDNSDDAVVGFVIGKVSLNYIS